MQNFRNERGFPFLLPFLAGAVVGPLFFNGFGNAYGNQGCPNCGGQGVLVYPYPIGYGGYPGAYINNQYVSDTPYNPIMQMPYQQPYVRIG